MSTIDETTNQVSHTVARMHAGILAFICAMFGGLGLSLMTAVLLIQRGPMMGKHLNLLSHYFPGYSVSWSGCFLGFVYGALVGAIGGWCVGIVYNRIVGLRSK